MNRNQSRGTGRQIGGAVKDAAGKLAGDRKLQGEGKVDKGLGKLQKKFGDMAAGRRRERERTVPPSKDDLLT